MIYFSVIQNNRPVECHILHMLPIVPSRLLIMVVGNRVAFCGAGGASNRRQGFRRQLLTKQPVIKQNSDSCSAK